MTGQKRGPPSKHILFGVFLNLTQLPSLPNRCLPPTPLQTLLFPSSTALISTNPHLSPHSLFFFFQHELRLSGAPCSLEAERLLFFNWLGPIWPPYSTSAPSTSGKVNGGSWPEPLMSAGAGQKTDLPWNDGPENIQFVPPHLCQFVNLNTSFNALKALESNGKFTFGCCAPRVDRCGPIFIMTDQQVASKMAYQEVRSGWHHWARRFLHCYLHQATLSYTSSALSR